MHFSGFNCTVSETIGGQKKKMPPRYTLVVQAQSLELHWEEKSHLFPHPERSEVFAHKSFRFHVKVSQDTFI